MSNEGHSNVRTSLDWEGERRVVVSGETDFSTVAEDVSGDGAGHAVFTDTLPAAGSYEYRATPFNGDEPGPGSNVVLVTAA